MYKNKQKEFLNMFQLLENTFTFLRIINTCLIIRGRVFHEKCALCIFSFLFSFHPILKKTFSYACIIQMF